MTDARHTVDVLVALLLETDARLALRAETVDDRAFLSALAIACSPLSGVIPDEIVGHQIALQQTSHDRAYPDAMRRIVMVGAEPVGRLVVDWAPNESRCVEIAILPAFRQSGIGTILIRCWTDVVRRLGVPATLSVDRGSRAVALYQRLGFREAVALDPFAGEGPVMTMSRP